MGGVAGTWDGSCPVPALAVEQTKRSGWRRQHTHPTTDNRITMMIGGPTQSEVSFDPSLHCG